MELASLIKQRFEVQADIAILENKLAKITKQLRPLCEHKWQRTGVRDAAMHERLCARCGNTDWQTGS